MPEIADAKPRRASSYDNAIKYSPTVFPPRCAFDNDRMQRRSPLHAAAYWKELIPRIPKGRKPPRGQVPPNLCQLHRRPILNTLVLSVGFWRDFAVAPSCGGWASRSGLRWRRRRWRRRHGVPQEPVVALPPPGSGHSRRALCKSWLRQLPSSDVGFSKGRKPSVNGPSALRTRLQASVLMPAPSQGETRNVAPTPLLTNAGFWILKITISSSFADPKAIAPSTMPARIFICRSTNAEVPLRLKS